MLWCYSSALLCAVIKAERISNDSVDNEYVFPDDEDSLTDYGGGYAQVMVPAGLLQNISKLGSKFVTTIQVELLANQTFGHSLK